MNKKLLIATCIGVGLLPATSFAVTTLYTYSGQSYSSIRDDLVPAGTYTNSMRTIGSIALQDAIAPNSVVTLITGDPTISSFSFSDGRFTYTPGSADGWSFTLDTNSTGGIESWSLAVSILAPTSDASIVQILSNGPCTLVPCDSASLVEGGGAIADVAQSLSIGNWTVTPVPEPSTYALFLAGIALVGFAAHLRQ